MPELNRVGDHLGRPAETMNGAHHAAIIGKGLLARRLFHQEPRARFGRRLARRAIPDLGRHRQQPRLPVPHRRRHAGSCAHLISNRSHHYDCRCHRQTKSTSSLWINQKGTPFHWQAGYAVFSVSQSNVEQVRAYIATQEEHHRKVSFQDEFRALCRRHGVEIDERYVWD